MSKYEFYSLIISFFGTLGTCGAVILALYLLIDSRKIKLDIKVIHGTGYGNIPNIEAGYFVISVTNLSERPVKIDNIFLKLYIKKLFFIKSFSAFMILKANSQSELLPKTLDYNESYQYYIPMTEMKKNFTALKNEKYSYDLKISIAIPTAKKDIDYNLSKELKSTLLKRDE